VRPARAVIVLAKAPVPGRVKTRLCPPLRPHQAAVLAEAALCDTLDAVSAVPDVRRMLALDGAPGAWVPPGFDVVVQARGRLDERIAAAFVATSGPTVLVGMDTPQMQPADVEDALASLERDADAVGGPAPDGGYWLLGLRVPDPCAVLGVPMSVAHTCAVQLARLDARGLSTAFAPELRDVDHFPDALEVAAAAPASQFAHAVRSLAARDVVAWSK
jgi:uncharacterized protein